MRYYDMNRILSFMGSDEDSDLAYSDEIYCIIEQDGTVANDEMLSADLATA